MSLARSFAYAGSPSMLMTLWEVEDKSGVKLMRDYYSFLIKGMSKPEAMQNAKIRFIRDARPENSHPFFWSAYITMGNTDALFNKMGSLPIVFCLIAFAVVFLVVVFYIVRRKKTNPS
jgi:hypothetical protein